MDLEKSIPEKKYYYLWLAGVLLVAALLRLWRLDQNGFDNEYYAAAVWSMTQSWHNFFYNAFDPSGFVSVDKPPLALWVQVVFVKLFGFHGWSILLPQVLEGLLSVALVAFLVRRRFGEITGLLAGLFMALTPVSVAVDRSGNTDTGLVLVLLLVAWVLIRAAEKSNRALLMLSMALIGLGFNVKMMAAWVVLPTFITVYLISTKASWRRRISDLAWSALVLLALSLPWVLAYDLTSPENRPYVGSSKQNSMVELAVGHNALGRFVRSSRTPVALKPVQEIPDSQTSSSREDFSSSRESRLRTAWKRQFVQAPIGPLRLADGRLAAQIGWLLPLAIFGIIAGIRGRPFRSPSDPSLSDVILWAGWLLTFALVYSYAGGIFHFYYLATLAPPLAALAAIGMNASWKTYEQRGRKAFVLPLLLLLTAAWQTYIHWDALGLTFTEGVFAWPELQMPLVYGAFLGASLLIVPFLYNTWKQLTRNLAIVGLSIGLAALLVLPLAWALSSVLVKGTPVLPSADLYRLSSETVSPDLRARIKAGQRLMNQKLIDFLRSNRNGEKYLLASSTTRLAAPIIIQSGEPVMARGGFHGLDPILTAEKLNRLVEKKEIRFIMLDDLSPIDRLMGAERAGSVINQWVREHGRVVEPHLWRYDQSVVGRLARRMEGMTLYDLRPEGGLQSPPSPKSPSWGSP